MHIIQYFTTENDVNCKNLSAKCNLLRYQYIILKFQYINIILPPPKKLVQIIHCRAH